MWYCLACDIVIVISETPAAVICETLVKIYRGTWSHVGINRRLTLISRQKYYNFSNGERT
jgi:hypothetical protein